MSHTKRGVVVAAAAVNAVAAVVVSGVCVCVWADAVDVGIYLLLLNLGLLAGFSDGDHLLITLNAALDFGVKRVQFLVIVSRLQKILVIQSRCLRPIGEEEIDR
jgi:hypothetical protein